jgi:hypothetical protein
VNVASNEDADAMISVLSDDQFASAESTAVVVAAGGREKKKKNKLFQKRVNSLFSAKDMSDISHCVEVQPRNMPKCCANANCATANAYANADYNAIAAADAADAAAIAGTGTGTTTTTTPPVGLDGYTHICAENIFVGQASSAAESVKLAYLRQDVNEFLAAPTDAVTCENCSAEVAPEKMAWHIARDCGHVLSRCGYGCGLKMIRRELPNHMAELCGKRFVTCTQCHNQLWAEEVTDHLANSCSDRLVSCTLNCSATTILAKDIDHHLISECVNRMVTCLCGERVVFREWPEHDVADCVKKLGTTTTTTTTTITSNTTDTTNITKTNMNTIIIVTTTPPPPLPPPPLPLLPPPLPPPPLPPPPPPQHTQHHHQHTQHHNTPTTTTTPTPTTTTTPTPNTTTHPTPQANVRRGVVSVYPGMSWMCIWKRIVATSMCGSCGP